MRHMRHTFETALAKALNVGYAGEYADAVARQWAGRTDSEIKSDSDEFNQNFLRRERYARAAAMETNADRADYLMAVSQGR